MKRRGVLSRVLQSSQIEAELQDVCMSIERAIQELQVCDHLAKGVPTLLIIYQLRIGLSLERLTQEILKVRGYLIRKTSFYLALKSYWIGGRVTEPWSSQRRGIHCRSGYRWCPEATLYTGYTR